MKNLFIDTGAWVAINNKKDDLHQLAVNANRDFLNQGFFYITSDYVLDETYTFIRFESGHKKAVEFGHEIKFLTSIKKIQAIHINQSILTKAWDIFEKYSDKTFSFTDCTSFVIMEMMEIKEAFSFDKHFEQYGFIRLPMNK